MESGLRLDVTRCGRSASGVVWAGLFVDVPAGAFPERDWTDFAIVVITRWVEALIALLGGSSQPQEILFIEGPFAVTLEAKGDAVRVQCVQRRKTERIATSETIVPFVSLVGNAIFTAENGLNLCRQRSWWGRDELKLEGTVGHLRRLAATGPT